METATNDVQPEQVEDRVEYEKAKTVEEHLYKKEESEPEKKDDASEKDVDTLEKAVENNDKDKEETKEKDDEPKSKDVGFEAKDLEIPDDLELEDGFVDSVVTFAKEHKLSKDQAQNLINRDIENIQNYYKSIEDQKGKWLDEIKADEKYGGDKLKETSTYSQWALNQFGSDEFKQAIKGTQWEFHPGLIKLLANVGKKFAPKDLVNPGMESPKPKTLEERIYGTTEG